MQLWYAMEYKQWISEARANDAVGATTRREYFEQI